MKEYFKYFSIPFIIVAIMAVITIGMGIANGLAAEETLAPSANTERLTEERVFDGGDVLSDSEEAALREQIAEAELKTQSDIIIITLNESLEDYVEPYEAQLGFVPTEKWVMVYADNFYDENLFGYEKAHGSGVVLLDNWFRESDGNIHSWMSTSGKVETEYSSSEIDRILNKSLEYVDSDPYGAYSTFVELFVQDMTGEVSPSASGFKMIYVVIASVVIALIFFAFNWQGRKGKKTVSNRTYVVGGKPNLTRKQDVFMNKTVSKTRIQTSSSSGSGGGGHHTSSGGFSHGGGGHSR